MEFCIKPGFSAADRMLKTEKQKATNKIFFRITLIMELLQRKFEICVSIANFA